MTNWSMQTLSWSGDKTPGHSQRELSCGNFSTCHFSVGSKTWGIFIILRFIHIWFHAMLCSSSWIIWFGNGNLVSSKIKFLHSFNQFKRIRHLPKQNYGKRNLLEPQTCKRLRHDMKSTWMPQMQSEDMWKQRHLLNVQSAKSPTDFSIPFSIGFKVWDDPPTFQKQQLSWLYIEMESRFLSRGFFHSWWSHTARGRHSWPLYVEFLLSIGTLSASSEPTLLQCSSGGTQWHTLE